MSACCFISNQPSSSKEIEREREEEYRHNGQICKNRSRTNTVFYHSWPDHIHILQLSHTAHLLSCILCQSLLRCGWSCCSMSQHGETQWGLAVRFEEIRHPVWFGSITLNQSLHPTITASPHKCCVSPTWAHRTTESISAWPRTGWAEPRLQQDSSLCPLVCIIKFTVN